MNISEYKQINKFEYPPHQQQITPTQLHVHHQSIPIHQHMKSTDQYQEQSIPIHQHMKSTDQYQDQSIPIHQHMKSTDQYQDQSIPIHQHMKSTDQYQEQSIPIHQHMKSTDQYQDQSIYIHQHMKSTDQYQDQSIPIHQHMKSTDQYQEQSISIPDEQYTNSNQRHEECVEIGQHESDCSDINSIKIDNTQLMLLGNVMEPIFDYEDCEIKSEISLVNCVNNKHDVNDELVLTESINYIQPLNPRDDECLIEKGVESAFHDIDNIIHDININEKEQINIESEIPKCCEDIINKMY